MKIVLLLQALQYIKMDLGNELNRNLLQKKCLPKNGGILKNIIFENLFAYKKLYKINLPSS
jgi:hypothetical protein